MSAHVDGVEQGQQSRETTVTTMEGKGKANAATAEAAAAATNYNHDPEEKKKKKQQQQQQQLPLLLLVERPYRRRIKLPPSKIHHVRSARFRRFVQKHTIACSSSSSSLPAPTTATTQDLLVPSSWSMQDAYVAWCSSNGIVLSPGTMADLISSDSYYPHHSI